MKLYTKSGDDGTTGLFGGARVSKDHPRVEAYGTVDELNAALGLAAAAVGESEVQERLGALLVTIQSRLFDLGADLATPVESAKEGMIVRIADTDTMEVEAWIDEIDAGNDTMRTFVLPGGCDLAAHLHLARTVCRRAERAIVTLAGSEPITPAVLTYLNRVSDLLFAMARRANKDAGVPDVPWNPRTSG